MANFQKDKKYHFTYKTTNLINKRYYLGMHSTNNLSDNYIGSGKRLWYEIRKYGKQNFKIEILNYYNSREELVNAEIILITEQDLNNNNCLNLKPGGSGGFTKEEIYKGLELANKKRLLLLKEDKIFRENLSKSIKQGQIRARENGKKFGFQDNNKRCNWRGRKHSPETIEKMKDTAKIRQLGKGNRNSQYGTCWITDGKENKKIKKGEIIPKNWKLGRI
jgi:hypothetical protein